MAASPPDADLIPNHPVHLGGVFTMPRRHPMNPEHAHDEGDLDPDSMVGEELAEDLDDDTEGDL